MARGRLASVVVLLSLSITLSASGAPAGPSVIQISASGDHTCALMSGGGVKCWGSNWYGQLGNGKPRNCGSVRKCPKQSSGIPVDVVGLRGVKAISAGGYHTCALTNGGAVKCWGYNATGQVGNGVRPCPSLDVCPRAISNTPVDVIGLGSGVSAVSAGGFFSCALTTKGGVKCWGANLDGQLGNPSGNASSRPVDVAALASGVSSIAAGGRFSCAVATGGAATCWGSRPAVVPGLASGVTAVSVSGSAIEGGSTHACALTTRGGVKCWGSNGAGQLGDGSRADSYTPVDVTGLTSGVRAIAVGGTFTCALTTRGGVKCWGSNATGELGNGSRTGSPVPVDVVGLGNGVAAISAGTISACALTAGGVAKCWGSNYRGTLGIGSAIKFSTKPVDVRFSGQRSANPIPPGGSGVAGRCSKATANAVAKRLRLNEGLVVADRVNNVLCGSFVGPGSNAMAVSLTRETCLPNYGWAVLRFGSGEWRLVMRRDGFATLTKSGSNIREEVPMWRPGDSPCNPTGGTRARTWRWNGSRLVASPWKQAGKAEPEARGFDSPSLNINCGMGDSKGFGQVVCQSRKPPQKVSLDNTGRLKICIDPTPSDFNNECNLGDRGEGPINPLAYGKQITVGRFRCQSLEIGVRCTVIRSGKGFLINRDGVRRVGP